MNRFIPQPKQAGFIALTSVIVVSALLILIGVSLGYTGFFARYNIFDGELKETSLGLAEACAEIARVEIANNPNFQVSAPRLYSVGTGECNIMSADSSTYIVTTQGVYPPISNTSVKERSYSNIQADFARSSTDVTVESWKELISL